MAEAEAEEDPFMLSDEDDDFGELQMEFRVKKSKNCITNLQTTPINKAC